MEPLKVFIVYNSDVFALGILQKLRLICIQFFSCCIPEFLSRDDMAQEIANKTPHANFLVLILLHVQHTELDCLQQGLPDFLQIAEKIGSHRVFTICYFDATNHKIRELVDLMRTKFNAIKTPLVCLHSKTPKLFPLLLANLLDIHLQILNSALQKWVRAADIDFKYFYESHFNFESYFPATFNVLIDPTQLPWYKLRTNKSTQLTKTQRRRLRKSCTIELVDSFDLLYHDILTLVNHRIL